MHHRRLHCLYLVRRSHLLDQYYRCRYRQYRYYIPVLQQPRFEFRHRHHLRRLDLLLLQVRYIHHRHHRLPNNSRFQE